MRFATFFMGPFILGSLSGLSPGAKAQEPSALDFCPDSATFVVQVPRLSEAISGFDQFLESMFSHPLPSVLLQEGLESFCDEVGFNPLQRMTWQHMGVDIERDGALFLAPFTHLGKEDLYFGLIFPVLDIDSLKQNIPNLLGRRNRAYLWEPVAELGDSCFQITDSQGGPMGMGVAFRNGYVLVSGADGRADVVESLRFALTSTPISRDQVFGDGLNDLGEVDICAAFRPANLLESMLASLRQNDSRALGRPPSSRSEDQTKESSDQKIERLRAVAKRDKAFTRLVRSLGDPWVFGGSLDENGVEVKGWAYAPELAKGLVAKDAQGLAGKILPTDPLAAMRLCYNPDKINEWLNQVPDVVASEFEFDDILESLDVFRTYFGLDLRGLWKNTQGTISLGVGATAKEDLIEAFSATFFEPRISEAKALSVFAQHVPVVGGFDLEHLEQLMAFVSSGLPLTEVFRAHTITIGEKNLWSISPADKTLPSILNFGFLANTFVFGTSSGMAKEIPRLIEQREPKIDHQALKRAYSDSSGSYFYFDFDPVQAIFEAMPGADGDSEVEMIRQMFAALNETFHHLRVDENGVISLQSRLTFHSVGR